MFLLTFVLLCLRNVYVSILYVFGINEYMCVFLNCSKEPSYLAHVLVSLEGIEMIFWVIIHQLHL
jgi:hypothetical protein